MWRAVVWRAVVWRAVVWRAVVWRAVVWRAVVAGRSVSVSVFCSGGLCPREFIASIAGGRRRRPDQAKLSPDRRSKIPPVRAARRGRPCACPWSLLISCGRCCVPCCAQPGVAVPPVAQALLPVRSCLIRKRGNSRGRPCACPGSLLISCGRCCVPCCAQPGVAVPPVAQALLPVRSCLIRKRGNSRGRPCACPWATTRVAPTIIFRAPPQGVRKAGNGLGKKNPSGVPSPRAFSRHDKSHCLPPGPPHRRGRQPSLAR